MCGVLPPLYPIIGYTYEMCHTSKVRHIVMIVLIGRSKLYGAHVHSACINIYAQDIHAFFQYYIL